MNDKSFNSLSGTANETAEPVDTTEQTSKASKPTRNSSTSSLPATKKLQSKQGTSAANSPAASREASPNRPTLKSTTSGRSSNGPGRSRKNSSQDVSPARSTTSTPNPPSAAATQRALSAASIPPLHPATSDSTIKAPIPQKPSANPEIRETPRWPISPRLRSPPPLNKHTSILSPRKFEQETPAINVQRTSHSAEQQEGQGAQDTEVDDSLQATGMRTPARGVSGVSSTLETVQEISQPNTPGLSSIDGALEKVENGSARINGESDNSADNASNKTIKAKSSIANESGSESGGKGEIKMRSTSAAPQSTLRANAPAASKSFSAAGVGRGKPSGEGSTKNMTVETETVSSIPQVAVGPIGAGGNNGSIRTKPSTETIRPKKEKKKTARKAPSVTSNTGEQLHSSRTIRQHHYHYYTREEVSDWNRTVCSPDMDCGQGPWSISSGSLATSPEGPSMSHKPSLNFQGVGLMLTRSRPASSKADIFEAKVASAVDEANSSDSEETFVYESNPPDVSDRPRRFHSRTPSATSMASQVDQRNGMRSILDGHHSVAMKKSMKFANSYNSNAPEIAAGDDDGKGTARSNIGTGRGTTHHHHIGGRWSRNNGGNGHPSLFDNESPFPNAAKSKMAGNNPRHSSQPTSPRVANMRMAGNGRKSSPISSGYDLDDGADDERTPLISSTIRSNRSARGRRQNFSRHHLERQSSPHDRSFLARFAGCLVLTVMIILVVSGAMAFMFATTQPLTDVKVTALKNVLASEQDIIFDMQVRARNPNLVMVTVDYTDLVIFAKSKYAGTDTEWWRKPNPGESLLRRGLRRRDDDPLDPPVGDDPGSNPNLEIGHVYGFDSPLTFDGSPFRNEPSVSLGQIRIVHPGNHTIPAGSARWGRVLQHEFDLIVRGTLKYTLPLSQKTRSISVEGRVTVEPNAADQDPDDTVHIIGRV
ncbi:related to vacuolar protein VAC7 [Phialocephala subalpina]|uniref:Related to vacuolar protein VAC7 n=1 Tax=Phialocephala subalpina TaxID=576137 RepID=A0A1L7X635_9HELO|nr:related to vacuolar protein VAC7 [Phialocephala subalpina]